MAKASVNYSAEQIQVLEGLEAVRKRPGMYIGSVNAKGLHHLAFEIVDNAIDEAMAGFCDKITVILHKDGSVSVSDNGRGIPVDNHPKLGKPAVEVACTVLHAGGKFDKQAYAVSGGLHGLGLSVVNALSEWMVVEIIRSGNIYLQRFEYGDRKISPLKVTGKSKGSGTTIRFKPDRSIFVETVNYSFDILANRLEELAFLCSGVSITIKDERVEGKEKIFLSKSGIIGFVEHLNANSDGSVIHKKVVNFTGEKDGVLVEGAFQYNDSEEETLCSYVNNINTVEGGTHEKGFRMALTSVLNSYGRKSNLLKEKDENFTGEDTRDGLTAVLSVKVKEPIFEGQTKTKLGNTEVEGIVRSLAQEGINTFLEENPSQAKDVINRVLKTSQLRLAAKKAKELKSKQKEAEAEGLTGKLAACSGKDPAVNELFLVEGDSAGGSAKMGRNRKFQAILPLRGKGLNVAKQSLEKVLANEEIRSIITAIGGGVGKDFDLERCKYARIVIMSDADDDGAHIRSLLLTFFHTYMKKLLIDGRIFIAQPPLFKVSKGKEIRYAYSNEELSRLLKEVGRKSAVQRYKGLGEMNPSQLWETTMNPATRTLLQVELDDTADAAKKVNILMGKKVEPRKDYIMEHTVFSEED
ncbi:MAG TPA: DNA topoisomerase subunit B [Verrucomicrobiae bacterium]|nr:DNA topoisomerase subunit B [Verrucomicrobiae bacterium]